MHQSSPFAELENELYQLSNLLGEQSRLIEQMQTMNANESGHGTWTNFLLRIQQPPADRSRVQGDKDVETATASAATNSKERRDLIALSHKIDGINHLTSRPDRRLMLAGILKEERVVNDVKSWRSVYILLCNDSLVVCTPSR